MRRAAQGAALAVAVIAVGGLAWWLLGGGPATGPEAPPASAPTPRPEDPRPAGPGMPPEDPAAEAAAPEPAPGLLLRGRVLDPSGKPVPGATVQAREPPDQGLADLRLPQERFFFTKPSAARAFSAEDGSFVIRGLGPGRWRVAATASGFGPSREEETVLHPPTVAPAILLVLGRGHAIVVRVVDGNGEPLSGAEVVATRMSAMPWVPTGECLARASTEASGEARLEGLAEGRLYLVARAGPFLVAGRHVSVPHEGEVEIRLGGSATLVVRVTSEGGAPVEGAAVSAILATHDGAGAALLRGASGPDGAARFEGLPPGTVSAVLAEKTGFAPASLGGMLRRMESGTSTLREDETLELEVRLRPGASLAGTVRLQPGGSPVPGARVTLLLPELLAFGGLRSAVTDDQGAYRLDGLPGGRAVVFAHSAGAATRGAVPGGFSADLVTFGKEGPSPLSVEILEGPAETRHDILVEATGSVSGQVLGPDGGPAPGALVTLRGRKGGGDFTEPGEGLPPAPVLAGAEGMFRVEGVAPTQDLVAIADLPGYVPAFSDSFDVAAGAAVEGIQIRLAAGGVVLGRVTGPDGTPVAAAAVRAASLERMWSAGRLAQKQGRDAWTAADGTYRVEAFPSGAISVTVSAEGYVRRTVGQLTLRDLVVADGVETRVDVALEAGRDIRGVVRDSSGAPVSGARVAVRNNDRRPTSGIRAGSGTTGRDGTFRVAGLPAGSWNLTVTSANHPLTTLSSVDSGGPDLEIRLPAPVRISGKVSDRSGNPLAGVRVDAEPSFDGGPRGRATTAPDGTFEVRNLVLGPYRLVARPIAGHAEGRLEAVEGGTQGVEIRLERAYSIAGTVLGPDGNPPSGRGRVRVLDSAGTQVASTRWSDRGTFAVEGLPKGTYTLHARLDGTSPLSATATAAAGAEGVVLRLQPQ